MYESEANPTPRDVSVSADVAAFFRELRSALHGRTLLPWAEHCTECAAPACYRTCDLYVARPDGKCRRLVNGMVRVPIPGSVNGYVLEVSFKKWGMLHAKGNARMAPAPDAARQERLDWMRARAIAGTPVPGSIRRRLATRSFRRKWRSAARGGASGSSPDAFVIEIANPAGVPFDATLVLRPRGPGGERPPFQERLVVDPGTRRVVVPADRIAAMVPLHEPFDVDLIPNESTHDGRVFIGLVDLVTFTPEACARLLSDTDVATDALAAGGTIAGGADAAGSATAGDAARRVKCVVFDLDHTLWDGILIEDGLDGVTLRPGVWELLTSLDQRGILLSVASKNDPADARAAIERFGLAELFLHPQASWDPKSAMLARIASALNIGLDTFLFVDDQPFERAEVAAAHPGVRVLDAADLEAVDRHPGCRVPITGDGANRRRMYRDEARRKDVLVADHAGDYAAFLRSSRIVLTISSLTPDDLDRVHELTQRTNQMNFSGIRYRREVLRAMLDGDEVDTYVIRVEDRFGSYGTVGFGVVEPGEPRVRDLMFSCRVQAKRVEHAVLGHLVATYRARGAGHVAASWRKSDRNRPAGQVFDDLGFETRGEHDGVTDLVFPADRDTPTQDVITVIDAVDAPSGAGS